MPITAAALAELVAALGDDVVVTDPLVTEKYRHDWARHPSAQTPAAVVRAESTSHVQTALRWASQYAVPVAVRGAGTGLSGGSSGMADGIVIAFERMTAIAIDPTARVATVEPGALNGAVKAAAAEHGLWYPPDPASYEICSIGGNVATNAGGLCCVKYGVTTDYVLGLEVVLADGTALTLGGPRIKDTAGLSLLKLLVGSEGTLGVVTKVVLRLMPAQPPRSTLVATFDTPRAATEAVVALGQTLRPSMVEFMDQAALNAVEDFQPMGLDRTAGALLLIQTDAPSTTARADEISLIEQTCAAHGAREVYATDDPAEADLFIAARRMTFNAVEARGAVLHEDVGGPVPLLPDLVAAVAEVAEQFGVEIPVVAHAGDGNTHPLIIFDAADPDSVARAQGAFEEIMRRAIALGGTITGEHGVGRMKRAVLPEQLGPDVMELSRRVKAAFDPQGILSPGVML